MNEQLGQKFFTFLSIMTSLGILWEYTYQSIKKKQWYNFSDFMTNMFITSGHLYWGLITSPIVFIGFQWVHENLGYQGLKNQLSPWPYYGLGFLLMEFCQYWGHRYSHANNFFMAGHIVHHSSKEFNLSTAMRVSWVYRAYLWTVYLPLALVGYSAMDYLIFLIVMNGYNFWMHTRMHIPFGPLRHFMLTPEHHRVNHCSNPEYIDKNFGATMIIFDKIFGTYVEPLPHVKQKFGIKKNINSTDPMLINFHYFFELFRESKGKLTNLLALFCKNSQGHARIQYQDSFFSNQFKFKYILIYLLIVVTGISLLKNKAYLSFPVKLGCIFIVTYIYSLLGKQLGKNKKVSHGTQLS